MLTFDGKQAEGFVIDTLIFRLSQLKISAFAHNSVVSKFSKQQLVIFIFSPNFWEIYLIENYRINCIFVTKMAHQICFVCQEASIGHTTNSCPEIVCKNCGQKGHIRSSSSHVFTIHESTNMRIVFQNLFILFTYKQEGLY